MYSALIFAIILIYTLILIYLMYNMEKMSPQIPTFENSLLSKYRADIKDKKGLSVNDYVLQNYVLNGQPIPDTYKIY